MRRHEKWFFVLLATCNAGCVTTPAPGPPLSLATAVQRDPATFLFADQPPNCREWAEAANAYIALGEQAGLAKLLKDTGDDPLSSRLVRAGHLCRVLFESKTSKPLRAPMFGSLMLPYLSMPLAKWPEFPMVEEDGVWFELGESYMLGGVAELIEDYVKYCKEGGRFRTAMLRLPTSIDAKLALETLLKSGRWLAIKWKHRQASLSFEYAWDEVVESLRSQAAF